MAKIKILILGKTGMLGSMVTDYLERKTEFKVAATNRKEFDVFKFNQDPAPFAWIKKYDYLINCIGIIKPYCKDDDPKGVRNAIQVNAWFPHVLAEFLKDSPTRVIQIATDCVYSGLKGNYIETDPHDPTDVYGKTKSLGEVFDQPNFLNLRCSIIGPEIKGKLSLLEWFLTQPDINPLTGFTHHRWNGVTTLQFAKVCQNIISQESFDSLRKANRTLHYLPNNTVTKAELLVIFNQVFGKKHQIIRKNDVGPAVDRTLSTKYPRVLNLGKQVKMQTAIKELAGYLEDYGERWQK